MLLRFVIAPLLLVSFLVSQTVWAEQPNILLIMADDLGFSDLSAYGSEIPTPNLDSLAASGVTLSSFYTAPTCSPTRAMLMSGTDHHLAGLGTMTQSLRNMPEAKGKPGYEGYLNERVLSLPERLRDLGYRNYMTGKWDLGLKPEHGPAQRGFDRSLALIPGVGNHFSGQEFELGFPPPSLYREDGKSVDKLPPDFYSTRYYTDKLLAYLRRDETDDRPFFAYISYTAPHFPIQVPEDLLHRFQGVYDEGYSAIAQGRLERILALELLSELPDISSEYIWPDGSRMPKFVQRVEARRMELYAAMVQEMDTCIGELLQYVRESGQMDNTVVVFLSDNGPEGNDLMSMQGAATWIPGNFDNRYSNMGREGSFVWSGSYWARVSALPFRGYKAFTYEGGIRVPAIISSGSDEMTRGIQSAPTTVMDILPTLVEFAGGDPYEQNNFLPVTGKSLVPLVRGETTEIHGEDTVFGWELFGRRAVRKGDWKLVYSYDDHGAGAWELFNLAVDPVESEDLAGKHGDKVSELLQAWQEYVEANGVVVVEGDRSYTR